MPDRRSDSRNLRKNPHWPPFPNGLDIRSAGRPVLGFEVAGVAIVAEPWITREKKWQALRCSPVSAV